MSCRANTTRRSKLWSMTYASSLFLILTFIKVLLWKKYLLFKIENHSRKHQVFSSDEKPQRQCRLFSWADYLPQTCICAEHPAIQRDWTCPVVPWAFVFSFENSVSSSNSRSRLTVLVCYALLHSTLAGATRFLLPFLAISNSHKWGQRVSWLSCQCHYCNFIVSCQMPPVLLSWVGFICIGSDGVIWTSTWYWDETKKGLFRLWTNVGLLRPDVVSVGLAVNVL